MKNANCHNCGAELQANQRPGGLGYATSETDDGANLFACYDCCALIDKFAMGWVGRAVLYLTEDAKGRAVTNWPGTLRFPVISYSVGKHNMGRRRYDVSFYGPDRHVWHGIVIGENTQICSAKRTKKRA